MPRIQFSMRWLMVAITVACIVLFLAVTFGNLFEIVYASFIWCIVPTPLVVFAIFARGDLQAFAIGCLVPWAMFIGLDSPPFDSYWFATFWLLPISVVCGLLAAATRRWIQWNRWD
jgi:hypothetical protein